MKMPFPMEKLILDSTKSKHNCLSKWDNHEEDAWSVCCVTNDLIFGINHVTREFRMSLEAPLPPKLSSCGHYAHLLTTLLRL